MQNNLHELWALLNFLLPEIFSSAEKFDEWFNVQDKDSEAEVVSQLHKVGSSRTLTLYNISSFGHRPCLDDGSQLGTAEVMRCRRCCGPSCCGG